MRAFDVLARSRFLTIGCETSDVDLRSLLGRLRTEAVGASPEVRSEAHFHALLALLESGRAAWASDLDMALGVTAEPVAKPDGKPKNPAWRLWRVEVSRGVGGQKPDAPSTWKHDSLWDAARAESAAVALESQDCWETAARLRAEARTRLARALAERGEVAA